MASDTITVISGRFVLVLFQTVVSFEQGLLFRFHSLQFLHHSLDVKLSVGNLFLLVQGQRLLGLDRLVVVHDYGAATVGSHEKRRFCLVLSVRIKQTDNIV